MRQKLSPTQTRILSTLFALLVCAITAQAQVTAFTYQGRLTDGGAPANGQYDFEFKLFNSSSVQQGITITSDNVQVDNGVFTVQLDFGNVFDGAARLLEIGVRPGASVGAFTTLTPRQPITPSPYAIQSVSATTATTATNATNATNATTATNSTQLGGVAAANYLQTTGNGSGLTNLNASNLGSGTIPAARLPNLAGDVTGPPTANTVTKLQGRDVSNTAPANTNVLTWNGSAWTPAAPGGGGSSVGTVFAGRKATSVNTTSPYFMSLSDLGAFNAGNPALSQRQAEQVMPVAGTIDTLRVDTVGAFGSSATYTLYKNGAATSLACVIAANADPGTCTATGTVAIAVGDKLHLRMEFTGNQPASNTFYIYTGVHLK